MLVFSIICNARTFVASRAASVQELAVREASTIRLLSCIERSFERIAITKIAGKQRGVDRVHMNRFEAPFLFCHTLLSYMLCVSAFVLAVMWLGGLKKETRWPRREIICICVRGRRPYNWGRPQGS